MDVSLSCCTLPWPQESLLPSDRGVGSRRSLGLVFLLRPSCPRGCLCPLGSLLGFSVTSHPRPAFVFQSRHQVRHPLASVTIRPFGVPDRRRQPCFADLRGLPSRRVERKVKLPWQVSRRVCDPVYLLSRGFSPTSRRRGPKREASRTRGAERGGDWHRPSQGRSET